MTTNDDHEKLREDQWGVREGQAGVREGQAGVREKDADVRRGQADIREEQADVREGQAIIRESQTLEHEEEFKRYIKIVLWAAAVLFVIGIASILRSFFVEDAIQDLNTSTEELRQETDLAKDAAVEARDALNAALEESETRRGASGDAIVNALLAIDRIERQLCGGPCDQP